MPQTGVKHMSEESAPEFEVTGIYHWNLLDVIVSACQSTSFLDFHLKGFKEMWDPGNDKAPERVFGEVYTSDVYLAMEDEVQSMAPDPDGLETVVVPCMLIAALWPIYLLFARPTSGASHHLVYMPSVYAYLKYFEKPASPAILTFLKCELVHAIWAKLLSPEFMDAYVNGIVIFSDYPEKVLLASIKSMVKFLCPRCLATKEQAQEMGTVNDMKRHIKKVRVDTEVCCWIYEDGNVVDGKAVNDVLNSKSLSPTWVCWYSSLEEIPC
ncbi:hypothetical protein ARMGADRAFT_1048264 [Armillaria gallica]|uniref:Uncharacterized protein n=1 Tax=Armillaria gallica TaxID=47427 RepID=A0A2H3CMP4_ARMGA|nr:hypothetical protein ARMGADRAFT_1048264 [Armillaria gallica]